MAEDFILPSFLQGQLTDEIHQRMMANLPPDIDQSAGGFPWDLTRPTAIEKAEMVGFSLVETIKNMFPMFADDYNILNYHAENRGIPRKAAVRATVSVTIKGTPGTKIPNGFLFSTQATNDAPAVEFETTADATIPDSGTLSLDDISAVLGGTQGNVGAGSIIMQVAPIDGIKSVTNPSAASGGEDEETDDALRERMVEYDQTQGQSFVGSPSDYKRWALKVDGVGSAKVVSATDDSGLVTIIITDAQGNPASSALCTAVYNYIVRPDDEMQRLAPVNGANLSVITPTTLNISVSATVKLETSYTIGGVSAAFLTALKAYLLTCSDEVRYTKIGSLLMDTSGVNDYSGLTINGGTSNISILATQLAVTDAAKVVLNSAS